MTRCEHIGDATLYLGRCEDVDLEWRQRHDLLLTDPPYGVGAPTRNVTKKRGLRPYDKRADPVEWSPIIGDNKPFDPAPLLGFCSAVLWGANNYANRLPASSCWLVWDRKVGKAADSDITDCELAWTNGLPFKTVRLFRHMWAGFQRDSEVGERHLHPAQKPIALMEWCLSFFDNETVVDPYMGSGTVGIAAFRSDRRYIGIERDPAHYETALRRIEEAHRQRDLFVHAAVPEHPVETQIADLFAEAAE